MGTEQSDDEEDDERNNERIKKKKSMSKNAVGPCCFCGNYLPKWTANNEMGKQDVRHLPCAGGIRAAVEQRLLTEDALVRRKSG